MSLTPEVLQVWRTEMESRMAAAAPGLKLLRTGVAPSDTGVLVTAIRDELVHLPHFLGHHRRAGVRRFAIIDNGSVDGSLEYLLAQPDCDVYCHRGDYLAASASMVWRNLILRHYRDAAWHLSIDADELVVYPGWPDLSLDGFAAAMRATGRRVVNGIMIDMYGEGPVLQTRITPDADLLAVCPLFDGDSYTIDWPADWRAERFPRLNIRGGPEMRAIRPRPESAWLVKMALVLEPGILYRDPHTVHPEELNFDLPRIGILHFRFTAQLAVRLGRLGEGRATPGAVWAYEQIATRLRVDPGFSCAYQGSVRFTSPRQLVERGLIVG